MYCRRQSYLNLTGKNYSMQNHELVQVENCVLISVILNIWFVCVLWAGIHSFVPEDSK